MEVGGIPNSDEEGGSEALGKALAKLNWGVVDAGAVVLVAPGLILSAKGLCAVPLRWFGFSELRGVREKGPGAWFAEVVCSGANGDDTARFYKKVCEILLQQQRQRPKFFFQRRRRRRNE